MLLLEQELLSNNDHKSLVSHIYNNLINDNIYCISNQDLYESLNKTLNTLCEQDLLESDSEGDWNLYLPSNKFNDIDFALFEQYIMEGLNITIKDFIRPVTSANGPTIVDKNGKKYIMGLIRNNGKEEIGYCNIANKDEVYTKQEFELS
jgi:hypothetical protein